MIFRNAFCLLLFYIIGLYAYAQEPVYVNYTVKDGLPSNTVYEIYRDSKGFLWIATDKGVSKYNGIRFENFSTFNGLADNEVLFCQEDNYGRLWMATYNGKLCFYRNGKFHTALNTPYLNTAHSVPFTKHIVVEEDSSLTFVFHNQRIFLNVKDTISKIFDLNSVGLNVPGEIVLIDKWKENCYDIYYEKRKYRVDFTTKNIISSDLTDSVITIISSQNNKYIITKNAIRSYDGKLLMAHDNTRSLIYKIHHNSEYNILATSEGLFINDSNLLFKGQTITSVTQDVNGGIWVSGIQNGISKFNKSLFSACQYKDVYHGLVTKTLTAAGKLILCMNNGRIWSFERKDIRSEAKQYLRHPRASSDNGSSYCVSNAGDVYHLCKNGVLCLHNSRSRQPTERFNPNGLSDSWKMAFYHNGKLWGFLLDDVYFTYPDKYKQGNPIPLTAIKGHKYKSRIFSADIDKNGDIWYSTINNICKVSSDSCIVQSKFGNTGLKWMYIMDGHLIGITHDNHLLIYADFKSHKPVCDTIKGQDCIWNKGYKINDSVLILSTNNLYRLITIGTHKRYSLKILDNASIPLNAEQVTYADLKYYFFKNGSITSVDKDVIEHNILPVPKIFFKSIKTNNQFIYLDGMHPRVIIPYKNAKDIMVSFATLSFSNSKIFYQYSLSDNYEGDWHTIQNEDINLLSLKYGDHILKVRVKDIAGNYSQPIVLDITVMRPIWLQWWVIFPFACILIIFLAWVVHVLTKLRLKKRDHKHKLELKFVRSEYNALNALMNPHFVFNSLNSIQGLINDNDKAGANEYLKYFAAMIRQNMHNVSKELIPLQKEIELICNYLKLEKLRFKDSFNYSIDIKDDVETELIMIPPLLIQPLVENAIKHGLLPKKSGENTLMVRIFELEHTVCIEIEDNGIGLSSDLHSSLHISYGLDNIRKRIDQLKIITNIDINLEIEEIVERGEIKGTMARLTINI